MTASDQPSAPPSELGRADGTWLLVAVLVASTCGLVYELVAGALSSYLLGDSVTQFSLVIGIFLAAMGLGAYLSKLVRRGLVTAFIAVEILVGLLGGNTALIGFSAFAFTDATVPILLALVVAVGTLVGMEIPLVVRILRAQDSLRATLARVLSADYVGALLASVLFPFLLLPHAGLVRGALIMGLANVAVGLVVLLRLRRSGVALPRWLGALGVASAVWLVTATAGSTQLTRLLEDQLYQDHIIVAQNTRYQRLIITRWRDDVRLYLNGHLQFSSVDEYRYHETLVHPAAALAERRQRALVLGGGDGLVARELLKYPEMQRIDLVDLDPAVTDLFQDRQMLAALNGGSLRDERVAVHNEDAMRFVEASRDFYDLIIMDLPDPSEPSLGKLYTRGFFTMVGRRLASGGAFAAQCTSPFRARQAYWSIVRTIEAARWGPPEAAQRWHTAPYHTVVPTFGTWGFVVASTRPIDPSTVQITVPTRYLRTEVVPTLFTFPPDMDRVDAPISVLDDPAVVRLYRAGYHQYLE